MSALRPISRFEAAQHLVSECHIADGVGGDLSLDALLPEYIRSSLRYLSLTEVPGNSFSPVHIRRLTNSVRNHLEALWPQLRSDSSGQAFFDGAAYSSDTRDPVAWHLSRLSTLGDVVNMGKGYLMPAPTKLIKLPGGDWAVIGGMATEGLKLVCPKVRVGGHGRLILADEDCNVDFTDQQDYADWVGWRPNDLQAWVSDQVHQAMRDSSTSASSFTDFEIYVSSWELRRKTKSAWMPAIALQSTVQTAEVMLCRTRDRSRYFLGCFVAARLRRERTVPQSEVRWIQLGLGVLHGLLPLASWQGNSLRLFPLPPSATERHLLAYAYGLQPQPGHFVFYVPPMGRKQVEKLLAAVGYRNHSPGG